MVAATLLPAIHAGSSASASASACTIEETTAISTSTERSSGSVYVPAGRQVRVRIFGSAREDWWFISHRLQANPVVELTGPGYFDDDLGIFNWYYVSEETPHYRTWSHGYTFAISTAGVYNFSGYLRNYFGTDLQKQVSAEVLGLNSLDCEAIAAFELAGPNPGLRHGESCWTACADPVSTRSGDFYDSYADIGTIPGRSPALSWTRTYLSARSGETGGAFGPGWSHNWNLRAIEDTATGHVEIRQESGASVYFDTDGTGGYTAPPRVYGTLSAASGGGWLYERGKFERFRFDSTGKLAHVEDIDGDETSLTYDTSGKLTTITDSAGRSLQVTWTADRITSIADPSTPARAVTYGYTPSGLLSTVTDVNGGVTSVAYDPSNRIVSVTDPRHNAAGTSKAVVNIYDTQGRVIHQTDETGDVHMFDYTTVADATGFTEVTRVTSGLTTTVVWSRALTGSPLDAKDPPATVVYTPGDYDKTLSLAVYRNVDPIAPISTVTTNGTLAGSTVNTGALAGTDEVGNLAVIVAAAADPLGPSDPTFTVAAAQHRTEATLVGTEQPVTMIADRPLAHGETVTLEAVYNDVADLTAIGLVLEHARPVGHFYHGDQLGSVRAVTNEYGELKTARHFDPYGIPVNTNGPASTTASTGGTSVTIGAGATVLDDFGFAGEWTDAETGFVYLRARYYDPTTGQFLTRDPLVAETHEPYAYASNDPVNMTDPTGLAPWDDKCIRGVNCPWSTPRAIDDQDVANFAGGVLNTITFGNEQRINRALGQEGKVDRCSGWYTGGEVAGLAVPVGGVGSAIKGGREIHVGSKGARIAPWGNRGPGRYHLPHYHRGKPHPTRPGQNLRDQGLKRHRPWETKPSDTSWWDRF